MKLLVTWVVVLSCIGVSCGFLAQPARAASTPNLRTLILQSAALGTNTTVNVLLPDGYATSARRYPVLYLLPGLLNSAYDWSMLTDLPEFARHLPLIVVMPEANDGWYMDPLGVGPRWETYHIEELIPYIDRHFRTTATRDGRAVAGLSMGGFGAFSYAARHPDLFVAAASFSGVLAIEASVASLVTIGAPVVPSLDTVPDLWHVRAHDPVNLARNLRGLLLFMSSGNGKHGPLDTAVNGTDDYPETLEVLTHKCLIRMEAAFHSAQVPVTVDNYGAGIHDWPYWQRELHRAMPMILAAFKNPPASPLRWSYRTADTSATVWGYSIAVARPQGSNGFTDLADVQPQGFTVGGSGTVTLVTPPIYLPRHSYAIKRDSAKAATVAADAHGRLQLIIPLGGATSTAHITIRAVQ